MKWEIGLGVPIRMPVCRICMEVERVPSGYQSVFMTEDFVHWTSLRGVFPEKSPVCFGGSYHVSNVKEFRQTMKLPNEAG